MRFSVGEKLEYRRPEFGPQALDPALVLVLEEPGQRTRVLPLARDDVEATLDSSAEVVEEPLGVGVVGDIY